MFEMNPAPLDPKQIAKAGKRFEWLISFLICRFHFVHQILGMMSKIPESRVGTMGVRVKDGARFELFYNPSFVEALTDEEATFVFYHEVCHLALLHCTKRKFDNHDVGNIATDLAVNELIPENDLCKRPKDKSGKIMGVFVDEMKKEPRFKDILPNQSAEWYYDYLMKRLPKVTIKIKQNGSGEGDGKEGKDSSDKNDGKDKLEVTMIDNHDEWKENEIANEKVRAKIAQIDKNDLWGDMSQGVKEIILAAQTHKINWRNVLRRFYGNMAWRDRETTRKRPNRRTGFDHPGYKHVHVDRHLVAADTSGSVNSDLLGKFLTVLNGLTDFVPIDLMQFDSEKQTEPRPFDRRMTSFEFKGRGGTDFQPVIDLAVERRYRSLLILTDGCAAAPTKPPATRVVWVLPEGCEPPPIIRNLKYYDRMFNL
jgi:predicted metal-dependent peptidase